MKNCLSFIATSVWVAEDDAPNYAWGEGGSTRAGVTVQSSTSVFAPCTQVCKSAASTPTHAYLGQYPTPPSSSPDPRCSPSDDGCDLRLTVIGLAALNKDISHLVACAADRIASVRPKAVIYRQVSSLPSARHGRDGRA
ncbi:hypothetical protein J6590_032807 [Homalodisca vitripennis]|nr:hypothetical protein J6590_032807 [Homalodisca vitripennis]